MKKFFMFALAAVAMASCTNDEFLGEGQGQAFEGQEGAILFSATGGQKAHKGAQRRVGDLSHATSAEKLAYKFQVYGTKTVAGVDQNVFAQTTTSGITSANAYWVWYGASTANTTESNTHDWEYVGVAGSKYGTEVGTQGEPGYVDYRATLAADQTIKYWDYDASQYDFVAWSNTGSATISNISKSGYTVAVADAAQASKLYIADKKVITKPATTTPVGTDADVYGSYVQFRFQSMGAKVRLGIYETVPGYTVKVTNFRPATAGTPEFAATGAAATLSTKTIATATYNVTFDTNKNAKTAITASTTGNALNFGTWTPATVIGTTSTTATYAVPSGSLTAGYADILPYETKADSMILVVDYTLTCDASGETINVKGAKAVVPAAYCQWKPNYAYTYLFKISDNTNGTTGTEGTDPAGLYPITFDAVVTDVVDGFQETITTVADPSITTYQAGVVVTANNEYKAGDIYAHVENVTLSSTNCCYYEVTAGANLANEALIQDQLNGKKSGTGITLTQKTATIVSEVPAAGSTNLALNAAKYTVEAGNTYVFCYKKSATENYVKVIKVAE